MRTKDKGLAIASDFSVKYMLECGFYANQEELVKDAVRSLFLTHPQYKIEVAIKAYEKGEVSLGKASQIAGLNFEEMKELLVGRGYKLRLGAKTKEEAKREAMVIREAKGR